ncbi:2-dehydro-3-deoxyphosphooctonate aldolase 2 isoform X4 [Rosa chinensis]|nr:2-dehydro-3-deoxyphosphooctonate aldolase 2 isoform X4 [Rosa chinensis]XP_024167879.1 2-dehydro-3-deoxyphosphooctonate aldolase 2 isoform X4 [Rosa chinensis]XP_024167881.1 2-dehydro-3-deoxyphosphooctonate aldolase 2 isoform X4 [Rosa chinensis]XP_024167882.1 2-dehydro-3-deoxyphosphooctonate aldolase 2 isoform X4 [Rosa chinensis]XP_040365011.1 2-dehydro-3-deoxyphosphooctonate aldolase 2 isoform X4 [Rosa chinensis]XP_040365012.1 2-dehydro-3-deoxyphosphooctonate aldolase 2 isoform X4 [Rosa chin
MLVLISFVSLARLIPAYTESISNSALQQLISRETICSKVKVGLPLVFKSSFDKANRTSSKLFRGPGMAEGLKILKKVKIAFDLPIVTNVHEFIQCEEVGKLSCRYHSDSCIFMPSDLLSCMVDLAGKDGIAKVGCQEVFICNKARFCSNEAMRATKLAKLDSLSKFLDVYC